MKLNGRLELTWTGKEDRHHIERRLLIEDKTKSYGDPNSENMLIHGDNLLALKALGKKYTGKIKCVFIDPPYNTGSAFDHYDDNLEHSIWLDLMSKRLSLLKKLLSDNGTIFIQIDDNEMAYLKVLCDEIFGRNNYLNMIAVNAKVSAGASGGGEDKKLKKNIEYILVYCKNMEKFESFKPVYKKTELMSYIQKMKEDNKSFKYTSVLYNKGKKVFYKTIKDGSGEDIDIYKVLDYEIKSVKQVAELEGISEEQVYYKFFDDIMTTTNAQTSIRTRIWDATDSENNMYIGSYIPKSGKNKGKNIEIRLMGKQKVLLIWLKDTAEKEGKKIFKKEKIGTYWDGFSWINVTKEGGVLFPSGKKPESLIKRIFEMTTDPGDLVLDSFLGSGTTCAVAHKMNRRYIGIEMGNQAYTHCKVRLDKIIDGTDLGGITKEVNWLNGGGYHFYELSNPLFVKHPILGFYQINPTFNSELLKKAICDVEGYEYKENGLIHGYSTEKHFIHITRDFVNGEYVQELANCISDDESLTIYSMKYQSDLRLPDNIEIVDIMKKVLPKCVEIKEEN